MRMMHPVQAGKGFDMFQMDLCIYMQGQGTCIISQGVVHTPRDLGVRAAHCASVQSIVPGARASDAVGRSQAGFEPRIHERPNP